MIFGVHGQSFVVGCVPLPVEPSSALAEGCREPRRGGGNAVTIEMDREATGLAEAPSVIENALRWLATRKEGEPLRFLRYALEDSSSESSLALACLVEPVASIPGMAPESRAFAVWGLIVDEISKLGSAEDSRRRNTLMAAFRLPPAPDTGWKATLDNRFRQLMGLRGVFGDPPPTTTTPMHKAWRRAVGKLAGNVLRNLDRLWLDGQEWQTYVEIGRAVARPIPRARSMCGLNGYRAPSGGAQPVFMERMLVRAVMHRKAVTRRTTERDLVAREDGVDGYDVSASTGWTADLAEIPVKALWACRPRVLPARHPGDPMTARVLFSKMLRRGDRYHFVSEVSEEDAHQKREWINVEVDHHGIAPATFNEQGKLATGLMLQLNFDPECLPEACWWYAEQLDLERRRRPPAGDPHLLDVGDGFVQHAFECRCQPRENYGIAFRWPQE
jgi:hypothetical protein